MDAIEYFKGMRERLCEDYLKLLPKDSVGYQATFREMSFYDEAIKALEQKPCEDAISRQAAIRLAEQGQVQGFEWQFKQLIDLPSVSTEKTRMDWNYGEIKELMNNYHSEILNNYLEDG